MKALLSLVIGCLVICASTIFAAAPAANPADYATVRARTLTRYRNLLKRWNNVRSFDSYLTAERKTRVKSELDALAPAMKRLFEESAVSVTQMGESPARGGLGATTTGTRPIAELDDLEQRVRRVNYMTYSSRKDEIRAIWYYRGVHSDWDEVCRKLKDAGFNTIYVRVARGGNSIYPSQHLPMDAWAKALDHDELKEAIDATHRFGLKFIAWKVNFHAGTAPPEFFEQLKRDDRLCRDSQGRQSVFLNPADPRNTQMDFNVAKELVEKYNLDGYQFDYIRYPDEGGLETPRPISFDFDYTAVSRREFERMLDARVADWPEDVISGDLKIRYEDWERSLIDRHVERIYKMIKATKPKVEVGAAVWRNPGVHGAAVKQEWRTWVEKGWLDVAVPMDYSRTLSILHADLERQMPAVAGRVPLVIGLGSYLVKTPEEVLEQIELARKYNTQGFGYFSWFTEHRDEDFAAMRLGVTAEEAGANIALLARIACAAKQRDSLAILPFLRDGKHAGQRPLIGVWKEGLGMPNLILSLRATGYNTVAMQHLAMPDILGSQVAVIPQVTDYAVLFSGKHELFRDCARMGGRLLLTRDAVGFGWHPRWFREVGVGSSRATRRVVEFVADDAPVRMLTHMSSDHVLIKPTNGATVLARDPIDGAPVIVEGQFGKGKVILCGFAIGSPDDQFMSADEAAVLKWLVNRLLK